ncbi:MAG TPA: T9SS type A sorting domain-containing protein [Bacteroidota bacterium]|nr:T9SS type A sorting domain-containing protein [Bacteroidota bacterium]
MTVVRYFCFAAAVSMLIWTEASAQLTRQWVARFNSGLKKGASQAVAMTNDDSDNVYVTGWVTRAGTGADIVTIKYTTDGAQVWSKYFTSSGNHPDKPTAIAVDSGGYVYVSGSVSGANGLDYVLLKYKKDGSDTAWVRTYNGPGNGDDNATALAVNDSGNVYVTGWSLGAGTGLDYATLKYDINGNLKWVARYSGAGAKSDSALAMALRGFTDLYVTGASVDTTYDYLTIKYNAATGDTVWTAVYKGPGNDIPRAVLFNGASNLYVTGSTQGIGTGNDILTLHYNATTGAGADTAIFNGAANGDDDAYDMAFNKPTSPSRLYVVGKTLGFGSYNDFVTLKYSLTLSLDWVQTFNGTANDNDAAVRVAGANNPWIVGPTSSEGVGYDYGVLQYNGSNGNPMPFVFYNNAAANLDDIPSDVAIPNNGGGVVVTGTSKNLDNSTDIVTIKYVDQSAIKYRSFVQESLGVTSAKINLAGIAPNAGNVRDNAFTKAYPKIKYGYPGYPGGLVVGNARPDAPLTYGWMRFDKGTALTKFLPDTGRPRGLDSIGGKLFVKEQKDPTSKKYNNHLVGALVALRVSIGASDAEITPPTFGDLVYNVADTINGIPLMGMTLRQIASVTDNFLTYWRGYPPINWKRLDTIITRIDSAFAGPPGPMPWVSKQPLLVVPGVRTVDSVGFLTPVVAPLVDPLAFPPGSIDNTPEKYALYQNYPNPFNPSTTIRFDLPEAGRVSLVVYDLLGRSVRTLLDNADLTDGEHEVAFDARSLASGVYFYRILINNGQFHQIRKMLLLK